MSYMMVLGSFPRAVSQGGYSLKVGDQMAVSQLASFPGGSFPRGCFPS